MIWVMRTFLTTLAAVNLAASVAVAASSGPRFYGDAPDEHHPWAVHDGNRPQPKVVTPGSFSTQAEAGKPPSDAVVLFDGKDLSKWQAGDGGPAKWAVRDGYMEVVPSTGEIRTKEQFGDCQLHVEWAPPSKVVGDSQGRGNGGIFLMGMVEIQVLDSYNNITYADGHAASVYGVNPPMANALNPPGEFQVYDIVFRRPIYRDGQMLDPGHVTVFVNGVLAQEATPLEGPTGHMGRSKPRAFPEKGPLSLQDHGNPMRFRNIWYRPLSPRPVDGGTDGYLSTEATMAKRKEIAASIRGDAEKLKNSQNPMPEMLRWMESLVYEKNDDALEKVQTMADQYVQKLLALPADQIEGKKDEVKGLSANFKYMQRFQRVSADFGPAVALDKMIKEKGWDKERKKK
jgi:prepilin-type processing-associated H-X9-DG protein